MFPIGFRFIKNTMCYSIYLFSITWPLHVLNSVISLSFIVVHGNRNDCVSLFRMQAL